jgi:hypothetical protein
MSEAIMEKPIGYILLEEPTAFLDIETSLTHETYSLDGENIGFDVGDNAGDIRFMELTLHLYKRSDGTLDNVYLDVMNVPGAVFNRIAPITGAATGGDSVADDEIVCLRFEMLPEVQAFVELGLADADTLGDFLDMALLDGRPVFWDFHNWFTESILSSPA